jgi:hypothetical protein
VSKIFYPNIYLPHFVAGNAMADITKIIEAFCQGHYEDFPNTPDGKYELVGLKNIIVFYDEKGGYTPDEIEYFDAMKNAFYKEPGKSANDTTANDIWRKNRSAYATPDTEKPDMESIEERT